MSLSGRKEVPTQEDIHVRVLDLIREIQHAKIECDAENYSKNPDDENGEAKLLKDLEFLKMKLCEYMISLKERKIMRRGSLGSDRDSGISLDRSSVTSRDSFPIQERGDAVQSVSTLRSLSVNSPIENSEKDEDEKKPAILTNSERENLDRYDDYCTNRRPTKKRQNIKTNSIIEEKES